MDEAERLMGAVLGMPLNLNPPTDVAPPGGSQPKASPPGHMPSMSDLMNEIMVESGVAPVPTRAAAPPPRRVAPPGGSVVPKASPPGQMPTMGDLMNEIMGECGLPAGQTGYGSQPMMQQMGQPSYGTNSQGVGFKIESQASRMKVEATAAACRFLQDVGKQPDRSFDRVSSASGSRPNETGGVDMQQDRRRDRSRSRDKVPSASSSKRKTKLFGIGGAEPFNNTVNDMSFKMGEGYDEDEIFPTLDKKDLVAQIKELRKNMEGKRKWTAWLDKKGTEGKRDPSFYDAAFLQDFLNSWMKGATAATSESMEKPQFHTSNVSKTDPLTPSSHTMRENLLQDFKRRANSKAVRGRWDDFCMRYNNNLKDPQLCPISLVQTFINREDDQIRLVLETSTPAQLIDWFGPCRLALEAANATCTQLYKAQGMPGALQELRDRRDAADKRYSGDVRL